MDVGKLEEMKRRRDAALEGVDWKVSGGQGGCHLFTYMGPWVLLV